MPSKKIKTAFDAFSEHYKERYQQEVNVASRFLDAEDKFEVNFKADPIRPGNYPRILHHGVRTSQVIVLTHGLSDSPHYVRAIAQRFFDIGCNVVIPLLPAHGLKDPKGAIADYELDEKWRVAVDNAVFTALHLGDKVSLGGFSMGGALSLNKILRDPEQVEGGLFLFSSALDLGVVAEGLGKFSVVQTITKYFDGEPIGIGRDPYKYPSLPYFGGTELIQIINDNDARMYGKKITHPVFVAHSIHDTTVNLDGVLHFLAEHVEKGRALILSENVSHSELVLEKDIPLDTSQTHGPQDPPRANPKFNWMMDNAIRFFQEEVL